MEFIGGQAVIEGVMMKNKNKIAVAVRDPQGKIHVKHDTLPCKEITTPFLRGVWNLFIVLYTGIKSLSYSSHIATGKTEEKQSTWMLVFTLIFSLGFALFIFKFIPLLATDAISTRVGVHSITYAGIEGLIKISIFIAYIYVISRMKDIQRVFQYHGAEHKTVNCYEAKKQLTPRNCQKFSLIHTRCGTTFTILVLFLSIFVYVFIPQSFSFWTKLFLRILLLPVVASLSYELLRFAATQEHTSWYRRLLVPGLLFQKMTTNEPDEKQLEVAIVALKAVL